MTYLNIISRGTLPENILELLEMMTSILYLFCKGVKGCLAGVGFGGSRVRIDLFFLR